VIRQYNIKILHLHPVTFWSYWSVTVSNERFRDLASDLFCGGLQDVISFAHLVSCHAFSV
jgi:hypothetical protein